MADRTIVCTIGDNYTLQLKPEDAKFLNAEIGKQLVMQVRQPMGGGNMTASISVAEGTGGGRKPRAFM